MEPWAREQGERPGEKGLDPEQKKLEPGFVQ